MAATPCASCGGKMHEAAVVCPHCGVRRAVAAKPAYSKDEIHALLATAPASKPIERNAVAAFVFPARPSGVARLAELALTAIAAPAMAAGVAVWRLRARFSRATASATLNEVEPVLWATIYAEVPIHFMHSMWLGLAPIAALWIRLVLRSSAVHARSRALLRLAPGEPAPPPAALPAARVVAAPPEPIAPPARTPSTEPAADDAAPPGEGPRFLR